MTEALVAQDSNDMRPVKWTKESVLQPGAAMLGVLSFPFLLLVAAHVHCI